MEPAPSIDARSTKPDNERFPAASQALGSLATKSAMSQGVITLLHTNLPNFFPLRDSYRSRLPVLRFLVFATVCLLTISATRPVEAQQRSKRLRRPNVILVMTDDQGYGDVGFHGNTMIQTPHLDELARQSVRLTDFHVDPTCAETRSALMTGRYSARVGVWHTIMGRSILRRGERTMADFFRAAGYRTGMFGKWHLGDNYPYRPFERGFEETLAHGGGGVTQTPDYWGNDYFDDTYFHNGRPEPQTGYCTDVFFRAAIDFIRRHRNEPFFCYLATNAPHGPYFVDPKYSTPYEKKGVPATMAKFYGMITNIDENMGRLLKALDELELRQNTMVIFMTDNGTAAGVARRREPGKWQGFNAGMRGAKGSQYEGGHRVPCFISWPAGKLRVNASIDRLAAHIDLLPTLAELCGLQPDPERPWDGKSLVPLLRDPGPRQDPADRWPSRTIVVHSQRIEHPEKWRKCSVMRDRWRLVDGEQLYDLKQDPGQQRDVADAHPQIKQELRAFYERWWSDLAPTFRGYVEIPIGDPHAPNVQLTAHDWHPLPGSGLPPWNQQMIRADRGGNGFWALLCDRPGRYRITLRMRPPTVLHRLRAGTAKVRWDSARGTIEREATIEAGQQQVDFEVELPAGSGKLLTEIQEGGKRRGAYFVTIRSLEDKTTQDVPDLRDGDRLTWLGAGLVERMQAHGYTETWLHTRLGARRVTFRNLGWSGDDVWGIARAVFGSQTDGFERLRHDLTLTTPTVVVVNYGANEASDSELSSEEFLRGLRQIVDLCEYGGARVIVMSPRAQEEIGDPLPDPSTYNARLAGIVQILKEEARRLGVPYIDLFGRSGGRLTDDGIHLTPFGYWRLGKRLADELVGPSLPWRVDFDVRNGSYDAVGCTITNVEWHPPSLRWTLTDAQLAPPPPPADAPHNARWLLRLSHMRVRHLPPGHYAVKVAGKTLFESRFDAIADGHMLDRRPGEAQAEKLRLAIVKKNELFFHRHRPQNETYLFLFRKHEQGNNAKEVFEFNALVRDADDKIEALRQPVAQQWEVTRTRNIRTAP